MGKGWLKLKHARRISRIFPDCQDVEGIPDNGAKRAKSWKHEVYGKF